MKYTFIIIIFLIGASLSANAQLAVTPPMGWTVSTATGFIYTKK